MPIPADQRRTVAALLIATSALSVLGMAHHPTGHGHGVTLLESLANIGPMAGAVHGALLAVMLAQLIGQVGLAGQLGGQRLVVQGAVVAQAAGAFALAGAAVVNGFTLSPVAESMVAAGYTQPDQFRPLLWALFGMARAWAQIGTAAWAMALALWGLAVWSRCRPLALAALTLLLVPVAGGLGLLPLDVIGFGAVVVAQAAWAAAAGVLLWRERL